MAHELRERKIAILATDGVEQVELEQPREEVVIDGNLVSSRNPGDLSAFCGAIVREFSAVHAS